MVNYSEIFIKHDGKVAYKGAHYFYIYDKILTRLLTNDKPISLLEIGVLNGGSLEIRKKYLPNGSIIHGLDINPKCKELKFDENIFFHLGDATNYKYMEKEFFNCEFDVILDDGSHKCKDVIKTFESLWSKIKSGGVYIIEDLCTSYMKEYGGGYKKRGSTIEYFKNISDAVNGYIKPKNCFINLNMKEISQISFFPGVLAVDKFYETPNSEDFGPLITGKEMNVCEIKNLPHTSTLETRLSHVKKIYTNK